jgi:hypothetical protein
MMERKKRVYNFVFNSAITSSFTGNRWDAAYRVDFKSIIPPESMKSSFLLTFRLKSLTSTSANFDPLNKLILLQANFGTMMRNSINLTQSNIIGALAHSADNYPTASTTTYSFDTPPQQNPPVYIDSIQNVTTIQLSFFNGNSATPSLFAGLANYLCILSFEEL